MEKHYVEPEFLLTQMADKDILTLSDGQDPSLSDTVDWKPQAEVEL